MNLRKLLGLPEEEVDVTNLVNDVAQPRAQHYIFAHRFLPALTFEMGAMVVYVLANPDRSDAFLQEAWQDVAQQANIPLDDQIAPNPLTATVQRIGNKLVAIIQLPPARAVTEAHFIAIVSDLPSEVEDEDSESSILEQIKQLPVRYLTLEYGYSMDNTRRTAFCEWTKEAHLNMGDGPEPTLEAFAEFLSEQNLSK